MVLNERLVFIRFRDLPNWLELRFLDVPAPLQQLSSEQRSAKETALVRSKLDGHAISQHEILSDPNQLRSLGLLQESMVSRWVVGQPSSFCALFDSKKNA